MSFSEASNRELNDELQALVAAGDEAARSRMIESNMRLAAYKVEEFIIQRPQFAYLKDDLLSVAIVGLTEGVNKIRDKGVANNPTALLAVCIERQLRSAVLTVGTVRPTRRAQQNGDHVRVVSGISERLPYEPSREAEVMEDVLACCETAAEREIVTGRAMGKNNVEIGAEVGMNPRRVGEVLRHLEKKYARRCES